MPVSKDVYCARKVGAYDVYGVLVMLYVENLGCCRLEDEQ